MRRLLSLFLALTMAMPLLAACGKNSSKLNLFEDGTGVVVYDSDLVSSSQLKSFVSAVESATGASLETSRKYSGDGPKILLGNIDADSCKEATKSLRNKDYILKIVGEDYIIGALTADAMEEAIDYFLKNILPGVKKGVLKLTAAQDYLYESNYKIDAFTVGGVSLSQLQIVVPLDCSVSEYRTAVLLQQYLKNYAGYELKVKRGKADENAAGKILIGQSLCEKAAATDPHSWQVAVNGTDMEIAAESFYGYEAVQKALQNQVFSAKNENKNLNDESSFSGVGSATSAVLSHTGDVRIMFNNIHGNCNTLEFPVEPVAQMMSEVFLEYLPDVLGLEECSSNMRKDGQIAEYLSSEYEEVDVSACPDYISNSRQNSTPLFYRPATVEVLKSGYFCYNALPYGDEAYSAMWQGCDPDRLLQDNIRQSDGATVTSNGRKDNSKGLTWAVFRVKATGYVFMVASTHLWWESNDAGDHVTRQIQLAYLKDLLVKECNDFLAEEELSADALPIFVGGDYNCRLSGTTAADLARMTQNTAKILCSEDADTSFVNTNTQAPEGKRNTITTHHSYATWNDDLEIYVDPQPSTDDCNNALDYIFAYKAAANMYQVNLSGMSADNYSYLSSDHCPVFIDVSFTGETPKT